MNTSQFSSHIAISFSYTLSFHNQFCPRLVFEVVQLDLFCVLSVVSLSAGQYQSRLLIFSNRRVLTPTHSTVNSLLSGTAPDISSLNSVPRPTSAYALVLEALVPEARPVEDRVSEGL